MSQSPLLNRLAIYNQAYAQGRPIVSDEVYDQLWQQVREQFPDSPLLHHTGAQQIEGNLLNHPVPMLGLDKIINDPNRLKNFLHRFANSPLRLQPKLDGLGAVLYNNPTGTRLALIGDGRAGTDFTSALPVLNIQAKSTPVQRGELVIPWESWNPTLGASPRHVVAGLFNTTRNSIPRDGHFLVSFISFQTLDANYYEPGELLDFSLQEVQEILLQAYLHWHKTWPCDGLVLTATSPLSQETAGTTANYPNWAIAWKPPIQTAQTTVDKLVWTTARTGRVVPTAHFSPVQLCGTQNAKAIAHHAQYVKSSNLGPGSLVTIGKAGEIIPQIVSVDTTSPHSTIPAFCPVCGTGLQWSGINLWCKNKNCVGSLTKRVQHFYSIHGLNLKGLGPKFFEKLLVKYPTISSLFYHKPWLLLLLDETASPATPWTPLIPWFQVRFPTHLQTILAYNQKLRQTGLPADKFLTALGLPYIGASMSTALVYYLRYNKPWPHTKISKNALNSFISHNALYQDGLTDLKATGYKLTYPEDKPGQSFSISGEFYLTRDEIVSRLRDKGWVYHTSPKATTDLFFLGQLPAGRISEKQQKAMTYNLQIADELELQKILEA